jgi:hypothetical protein
MSHCSLGRRGGSQRVTLVAPLKRAGDSWKVVLMEGLTSSKVLIVQGSMFSHLETLDRGVLSNRPDVFKRVQIFGLF